MSGRLLRLLRVPKEPRLPAGEPGSARVFRAGRRFWHLRLAGWGVQQAATLMGFVGLMMVLEFAPATVSVYNKGVRRPVSVSTPLAVVRSLEVVAWGLWLLQLPVTFMILRLDYELRWYIVTDRAVRLREGILSLTEMTFTLANVQDIRIQQGPLQRVLGLADLELRTAGGSDASPGHDGRGAGLSQNLHVARFRGVENAEAVRDLVNDRMKKARGAGLGDPDDAHGAHALSTGTPQAAPADLQAALQELLDESARLRAAASAPRVG
jgi:membrane protein YdbS with pleckstrin-like domain